MNKDMESHICSQVVQKSDLAWSAVDDKYAYIHSIAGSPRRGTWKNCRLTWNIWGGKSRVRFKLNPFCAIQASSAKCTEISALMIGRLLVQIIRTSG